MDEIRVAAAASTDEIRVFDCRSNIFCKMFGTNSKDSASLLVYLDTIVGISPFFVRFCILIEKPRQIDIISLKAARIIGNR